MQKEREEALVVNATKVQQKAHELSKAANDEARMQSHMNNDTERELQEVSQKLKETTLQLSQAQEELKTVRQQLSLQLDAKEFMNSHH